MKSVWATSFGDPSVLEIRDIALPQARPGEVLLKVVAVALTFVDTQIRSGADRWHPVPDFPYIPGNVAAGRIIGVGDDVAKSWIGRDVVADLDGGAFAEVITASQTVLTAIPSGVTLEQAAAVCTDGPTAYGLIRNAKVVAGEWVLVEAAAGGVGSILVQLLKAQGAKVIGAARGAVKLNALRAMGADEVVDYSMPGWENDVRAVVADRGLALAFDGVGGAVGRTTLSLIRDGGRFSIHGASSGTVTTDLADEVLRRNIDVIPIDQLFEFPQYQKAWLEIVLGDVAAKRLTPLIGQTFPIERVADAHAKLEARDTIGKTLVIMPA